VHRTRRRSTGGVPRLLASQSVNEKRTPFPYSGSLLYLHEGQDSQRVQTGLSLHRAFASLHGAAPPGEQNRAGVNLLLVAPPVGKKSGAYCNSNFLLRIFHRVRAEPAPADSLSTRAS